MSLLDKFSKNKNFKEDAKLQLVVYLLSQLYIYSGVYQEVIEKYGKDYVHSKVIEEIARSKGE